MKTASQQRIELNKSTKCSTFTLLRVEFTLQDYEEGQLFVRQFIFNIIFPFSF